MNRHLLRSQAWVAALALSCLASCTTKPTSPVVLPDADSIAVSPDTAVVTTGASIHFDVTAWDSSQTVIAANLAFQSSDPAVFTVDATGRVTARAEGSGVLRVVSGTARDSAIVVVVPPVRGWYAEASGVTGTALNGVFVLPDDHTGWVVGANGRILATTNGGYTWNSQASGTTNELQGVWFTSATEGWVVGKSGTALHTTNGGASWTRALNLGASEDLGGVRFAARDTGWVVGGVTGTRGIILRTFDRGLTWQRLVPTTFNLHALAFAGTHDGWAVGDGGVILGTHDRGLSWYLVQPFLTAQPLRGVWRATATAANAVGALGTTARAQATPDSLAWSLAVNVGGAYDLRDVCFPSAATGFAAGTNGAGTVLRTTDGGATWSPQTVNTVSRLNAVFFADELHGWAVGENGVILHTGTGGQP